MSYISPLANSTKISKSFRNEKSDPIVSTHLTVSNSSRLSMYKRSATTTAKANQKNSTLNDITTDTDISSINISITSAKAIATNKESKCLKDSTRKPSGNKKPMLSRKVSVKKVTEPIKAIANNGTCNNAITVEKILKQINMTKYQQSFRKIDVSKFRELKEIDLNAIGITRPSEIKIFMTAIKKIKSDVLL